MKIYVGCALAHAPEEFRGMVEAIKSRLRTQGYEVLEFLGLNVGTAAEVYERDIHECVAKCELFVAFCDLPSLGLGWELGTAVEALRKPTLALAYTESKVSRLPIGAEGERNPAFRFQRYESQEHAIELINRFAREVVGE
jgi:hypothetical protein